MSAALSIAACRRATPRDSTVVPAPPPAAANPTTACRDPSATRTRYEIDRAVVSCEEFARLEAHLSISDRFTEGIIPVYTDGGGGFVQVRQATDPLTGDRYEVGIESTEAGNVRSILRMR